MLIRLYSIASDDASTWSAIQEMTPLRLGSGGCRVVCILGALLPCTVSSSLCY